MFSVLLGFSSFSAFSHLSFLSCSVFCLFISMLFHLQLCSSEPHPHYRVALKPPLSRVWGETKPTAPQHVNKMNLFISCHSSLLPSYPPPPPLIFLFTLVFLQCFLSEAKTFIHTEMSLCTNIYTIVHHRFTLKILSFYMHQSSSLI